MQIRTRLTLQFMLVVALIIFFSFGVIYYSSATYRKKELYQRFENKARTAVEIFTQVDQIDSTLLALFNRTQKDKIPFENISIYDADNRKVYTDIDSITFGEDASLLDEIRKNGRKEFKSGDFEVLGITFHDGADQFVILAGAVDLFGFSKLDNLRNTSLLLSAIIITILAFAGWIYAGRALRPLSSVMNEVYKMNVDTLDRRLNKSKYNDEIGRLIDTFNLLLDRIENAFMLQKLFLTGASHELKNPLTSITSQLQVMLIKERSTDEYKTIIASILEDIKNLNKTTIDLIEFTRLNYENKIQLADVRIDDELWLCQEYFAKTNPDYRINIHFEYLPDDANNLIIKGNEALLKVSFINLIDNACKFSANKTCAINLAVTADHIFLTFADEGIGLTEDEVNLIFEPFYRTNSTSEIKGHGIGLALTKKIIHLHHASIDISSKKGVGTKFYLRFNKRLS